MRLKLHANATTTPKLRAYIQQSTASVADLVAELGVSDRTVSPVCSWSSIAFRAAQAIRARS